MNQQSINTVIHEWRDSAHTANLAISSRNFRAFRMALRKGKRHFRKLQNFLEKQDAGSDFEGFEEQLKDTALEWRSLLSYINHWKQEISNELVASSVANKHDRKVKNRYTTKSSHRGTNVRLKAR